MAKAIREAYGKEILSRYLKTLLSKDGACRELSFPVRAATVTPKTDFGQLARDNPWLEMEVGVRPSPIFQRSKFSGFAWLLLIM